MGYAVRIAPFTLLLTGLLPPPLVASAEVPLGVSYQGVLLDAAGAPISGVAQIELGIWTDPVSTAAGDLLFEESHADVAVSAGVFTLIIGQGVPISGVFTVDSLAGDALWLEIIVDGEILQPRQRLWSAPYALRSGTALSVGALQEADIVTTTSLESSFQTEVTEILETQVPSSIARDAEVTAQVLVLQSTNAALEARVTALEELMAGITRSADTLTFSGVNVQIVNGLGDTETTNATGNLIVGYNEPRAIANNRSGSHNIVVGKQHNFASYGGLIGGLTNAVIHPYSSVVGGEGNGTFGTAFAASVTGGQGNAVQGPHAVVTAGTGNQANGSWSSVSGGQNNSADGDGSSITGGVNNTASGTQSVVVGGTANDAQGDRSAILAGGGNITQGVAAAIVAGDENVATGRRAAILGGLQNDVSGEDSTVGGGINRSVPVDFADAESRAVFSDGGFGVLDLSSSGEVIDSITIEVPTNGQVSIIATAFVQTFNEPILGDGQIACELMTGTTLPGFGDIQASVSDNAENPFALTKLFHVPEGSHTFNLVCKSIRGDENDLREPRMTAIFTPTPGAIAP